MESCAIIADLIHMVITTFMLLLLVKGKNACSLALFWMTSFKNKLRCIIIQINTGCYLSIERMSAATGGKFEINHVLYPNWETLFTWLINCITSKRQSILQELSGIYCQLISIAHIDFWLMYRRDQLLAVVHSAYS